jgi:hypothetical protein
MNILLIFTLCLGTLSAEHLMKRDAAAAASAGDSFASASAGDAVAVAGHDDSMDFMGARRGRRSNFRQYSYFF